MNQVVVRGLVMAALHIVVRVILGIGIFALPEQGSTQKMIALLVLLIVPTVWSYFDGHADAYNHADPEDREDLTMMWLYAALIGALIAGAVCWALKHIVPGIGTTSIFFELTVGAAFVTLLIAVPATFGMLIGRQLGERKRKKDHPDEDDEFHNRMVESHHHGDTAAGANTAAGGSSTLTMTKGRQRTVEDEYYEDEDTRGR